MLNKEGLETGRPLTEQEYTQAKLDARKPKAVEPEKKTRKPRAKAKD